MKDKNKINPNKSKIWMIFFSVALVIFIPLLFDSKEDTYADYYGFPFDWLAVYPNNGFGFLWLGFIINVIIFYIIVKTIVRVIKRIVG